MNKLRLIPLLVLVLLLALGVPAQPAYAAGVMIDPFDTTQADINAGANSTACGYSNPGVPDILGGERDVEVQNLSTFGTVKIEFYGSMYNHSQGNTVLGRSLIQWDGNDTPHSSCPDTLSYGLGNVDLTVGGADNFIIKLVAVDVAGAEIRINVYTDNSSNYYYYNTGSLPASPQILHIPFTSFTTTGSPSWSNVDAITVEIYGGNAPSLDLSIDYITTGTSTTAVTLAELVASPDAALFRWQLAGFLLPAAAVLSLAGVGAWVRLRKQDNE